MTRPREILIVDDDPDIVQALRDFLEMVGYAVTVAVNGLMALRALKAAREVPCLILLDLMMPVMNGEEFLRELKKIPRLAETKVVIITADSRAVEMASPLGAEEGLKKPFVLDDLLSTLARHCPPS